MSSLKVLDLNGNCFGPDGIEDIRNVLENQNFINQMRFSDDEGSDEEEEEEEEGDNDYEEEYDEEEENDEDYEDEEEEEDEDAESPSYFFGNNQTQQPTWNNFQFGAPKTSSAQQESVGGLSSMIANFNNSFQFGAPKTNSAQQESVNDLSSMIANINVCSPFSFGLQSTIEIKENKWTPFTNLDKVKEHLKSDEQSIDRAVKLLEDMWSDNTVSQSDGSLIASNTLRALTFNSDSERNFNERLLVSLGFVKDEQTGCHRRTINHRDKIFKTLIDISQYIPKSTKNLLSVFLQNTPNEQSQCSPEIKQQLLSSLKG